MCKRVNIVIPALNEQTHIRECLQSILSLQRDNIRVAITVVDNGSTDRTVAIAESLGADVFVRKNVNISALRNFGARNSEADFLAFVDADCVVAKDWLNNALQCMEREFADAVGSFHDIPANAGWIGRAAQLIQSQKLGSTAGYIPSGNMIVKRSSYDAVGGFDESLQTTEDVELCHRLRRAGFKIFLDPTIKSTHLGSPTSIREVFVREVWHGSSAWTVFFQDLSRVRNWRVTLYSTLNLLLLLGLSISVLLLPLGVAKGVWVALLVCYAALNLSVAVRDWLSTRKGFLLLLFYAIIYGVARSYSILKWFWAYFAGRRGHDETSFERMRR